MGFAPRPVSFLEATRVVHFDLANRHRDDQRKEKLLPSAIESISIGPRRLLYTPGSLLHLFRSPAWDAECRAIVYGEGPDPTELFCYCLTGEQLGNWLKVKKTMNRRIGTMSLPQQV